MATGSNWREDLLPVARRATAACLAGLARVVTGVRPIHLDGALDRAPAPSPQRIYFANHCSHGDFILLSTCLAPEERMRTRAVAAADYWGKTPGLRFLSESLLSCVLIDRQGTPGAPDPLEAMRAVLDAGQSLILFPEGTRNLTDEPLQRFRSGLFNLAQSRPHVELVPAWIENMSRVLPKGHFLPVPLLCRVVFGPPVTLHEGEERQAFLARAHAALLVLDPQRERMKKR